MRMSAAPTPPPWSHNIHYHGVVLGAVPEHCIRALDVGCGDGLLATRLSLLSRHVTAIDTVDSRAEPGSANVRFVLGDVLTYPLELNSFDFLASVAVLHHLPLEQALARFRELVRPGGVVVIVGLYRTCGLVDMLFSAAGSVVSRVLRLFHANQPMSAPMQAPQATLREVRRAAAPLPGASIQRKMLFRYVLTWHAPEAE